MIYWAAVEMGTMWWDGIGLGISGDLGGVGLWWRIGNRECTSHVSVYGGMSIDCKAGRHCKVGLIDKSAR